MSQQIFFYHPEREVIFELHDLFGEKFSLVINTYTADILKVELNDVYSWLQDNYREIAEKHPRWSRKKQVGCIQNIADNKALDYVL